MFMTKSQIKFKMLAVVVVMALVVPMVMMPGGVAQAQEKALPGDNNVEILSIKKLPVASTMVNGKSLDFGEYYKNELASQSGLTSKQKTRMLEIETSITQLIKQGRENEISNYLESEGFKKQKLTSDFGTLSTKYDVSFGQPDVWYDDDSNMWYVLCDFEWKTDANGIPKWYCNQSFHGNVGGYEAVGLYFTVSENIRIQDYLLRTYDFDRDTVYHWTVAEDWSNAGVVFSDQDEVVFDNTPFGVDYNFHKGIISMWFERLGHIDTGIKMQYVHTWSETIISNVNISTTGIGFNVVSGEKYWRGVSDPYYWSY